MKRLMLLALFLLLAGPATAHGPIPVGVIDLDRLLSSSTEGRRLVKDYEELVKKDRASFDVLVKDVQYLRQKLQRDRATLSERELHEQRQALEGKIKLVSQRQREYDNAHKKKRNDILASFDQYVQPTVQAVTQESGISVLLRTGSETLVWYGPQVDITNTVLNRLQ